MALIASFSSAVVVLQLEVRSETLIDIEIDLQKHAAAFHGSGAGDRSSQP